MIAIVFEAGFHSSGHRRNQITASLYPNIVPNMLNVLPKLICITTGKLANLSF